VEEDWEVRESLGNGRKRLTQETCREVRSEWRKTFCGYPLLIPNVST
jgi:hypothetical protein